MGYVRTGLRPVIRINLDMDFQTLPLEAFAAEVAATSTGEIRFLSQEGFI
jgi:hypothetical protein